MAVGLEYLSTFGALPTGARTATAFQEGQKTASDIANDQLRQQTLSQAMRFNEMQQPYVMAGLRRTAAAEDIALRQAQETEAARGDYLKTLQPGGLTLGAAAQGTGYLPTIAAPAAAAPAGLTPGLGAYTTVPTKPTSYMASMLRAEGTGKNPMSSAQGPGQFIDSTFVSTFKKTFPDAARGKSDTQILAQRGAKIGNTPIENLMLQQFTSENQNILSSKGIEPTNANTYLAHFLGPNGAVRALSAPPNTPIRQVVDQASINANPAVFNKIQTVGDLQRWASNAIGMGGPTAPQPTANLFGLPTSERPIANALSQLFAKIFAKTPAAAPATPAVPTAPTQLAPPAVMEPAPMGATQTFSKEVQAALSAPPGAEVPMPDAKAYANNPPKMSRDMQIIQFQDKQLTALQQYLAHSGNVAGAAEAGLKRAQLFTTFNNLQGLQAISMFDLGDYATASRLMSSNMGRSIGFQPLDNGNFNLVVDGQTVRQNASKAEVKDMLSYQLSDTYKQQTIKMAEQQLALKDFQMKEAIKSGNARAEETLKQELIGLRDIMLERAKSEGWEFTKGGEGQPDVYRSKDGRNFYYMYPDGKMDINGVEVIAPMAKRVPVGIQVPQQ